ncbi:unnamed protein product [Rotaria socialis]|uniref:G-protein coupled receptors family 1 profile domain-containing protein n=1 Tax=Rotaria socialis TaxID=392032 RepID=A0A818CN61_9BILA|nr:unnamed protein product [Rotaria socialis]
MFTDALLISLLVLATVQINRHVALIVLVFETIGNSLNIWVLSERCLSENPCSIYLWWSSLSSVCFIRSGVITRVLQGINWPNQNQFLCKIRLSISSICFAVAAWALVAASSDRYLHSSRLVKYRSLSTVQTARLLLMIISTVCILAYTEVLYCYQASVPNVPVACYPQSFSCRLYNDWMLIMVNTIIPSFSMVNFGSLTIRNIRPGVIYPIKRCDLPNDIVNHNLRLRRNDGNISRMLLIQVRIKQVVFGCECSLYNPLRQEHE